MKPNGRGQVGHSCSMCSFQSIAFTSTLKLSLLQPHYLPPTHHPEASHAFRCANGSFALSLPAQRVEIYMPACVVFRFVDHHHCLRCDGVDIDYWLFFTPLRLTQTERGATAAMRAAGEGHLDCLKYLVVNKADVNAKVRGVLGEFRAGVVFDVWAEDAVERIRFSTVVDVGYMVVGCGSHGIVFQLRFDSMARAG